MPAPRIDGAQSTGTLNSLSVSGSSTVDVQTGSSRTGLARSLGNGTTLGTLLLSGSANVTGAIALNRGTAGSEQATLSNAIITLTGTAAASPPGLDPGRADQRHWRLTILGTGPVTFTAVEQLCRRDDHWLGAHLPCPAPAASLAPAPSTAPVPSISPERASARRYRLVQGRHGVGGSSPDRHPNQRHFLQCDPGWQYRRRHQRKRGGSGQRFNAPGGDRSQYSRPGARRSIPALC